MDDLENLFKYRKCNSYSFDDLFDFNLSFVTLSHFNDAMEGYIPYDRKEVYDYLTKKKSMRFYKMLINKESKAFVFGDGVKQFFEEDKTEQLRIVSSRSYKEKALAFIDEFAKNLFDEIRNSFAVSSFSEFGGHPVMWSHYSDDSSGFVEIYNKELLKNNFNSFVINEFPYLSKEQLRVITLHKITYGIKKKCTSMVINFIVHSYRPSINGINRFMQYINQTGDWESIVYVLTNKMKEWEYESEWRLILPRFITTKKRIIKENAKEYLSDYKKVPIGNPYAIVAGENIKKENLAALAYYCQTFRKGKTELSVQKRDFKIIEENAMKIVAFSEKMLRSDN